MSIAILEHDVRLVAAENAVAGFDSDFWIVLGGSIAAIVAAILFVDPVYFRFLAESML